MITKWIMQALAGGRWCAFETSGLVDIALGHSHPEAIVTLDSGLTKLVHAATATYTIEANVALWTRDVFIRENSTRVTATGVANAELQFIAVAPGAAQDAISVEYINPGPHPHAAGVAVVGSAITVTLASDAGGLPISTAAQVLALLNITPAVTALMWTLLAVGNTGVGVPPVMSPHIHLDQGAYILASVLWNAGKQALLPIYLLARPAHDAADGPIYKLRIVEFDRDLMPFLNTVLSSPARVALPWRQFTLGCFVEQDGTYFVYDDMNVASATTTWVTR